MLSLGTVSGQCSNSFTACSACAVAASLALSNIRLLDVAEGLGDRCLTKRSSTSSHGELPACCFWRTPGDGPRGEFFRDVASCTKGVCGTRNGCDPSVLAADACKLSLKERVKPVFATPLGGCREMQLGEHRTDFNPGSPRGIAGTAVDGGGIGCRVAAAEEERAHGDVAVPAGSVASSLKGAGWLGGRRCCCCCCCCCCFCFCCAIFQHRSTRVKIDIAQLY